MHCSLIHRISPFSRVPFSSVALMYNLSGTNILRYSLIPSLLTLTSMTVSTTVWFLIKGSCREWQTLDPLKLQVEWATDLVFERVLSRALIYLFIFW